MSAFVLWPIATYYAAARFRALCEQSAGGGKCACLRFATWILHSAFCHASAPSEPRLAGQLRSYLAWTIGRLQRDASLHPPMSARGEPLPQASVEALASYLASLEP
ncbi:MAG: hypothetical protein K0S54_2999 [Alphaproteobacteria bacterium]|jgi:cytochrome c553|nr:hypothetical protein [Alphaproteobacteria bacterium]